MDAVGEREVGDSDEPQGDPHRLSHGSDGRGKRPLVGREPHGAKPRWHDHDVWPNGSNQDVADVKQELPLC